MLELKRRGISLGNLSISEYGSNDFKLWSKGYPILLKGQCVDSLNSHLSNIAQTEELVRAILEEQSCDDVLDEFPYRERLAGKFESLGSVFNEGDPQEIEMVTFDALDGDEIVAENIWLKASWLSTYEDDASLRFRFSFGTDLEEDVAADPYRQKLSAELTEIIFPESSIITKDIDLRKKLNEVLASDAVNFVERIIYFNAPNGGAYFHHDLERGHAGVVFAQLTGSTFWLALPKNILIEEIINFSKSQSWPDSLSFELQQELDKLVSDSELIAEQLDSFANASLNQLINETKEFIQFLIARGHGYQLEAGDMLLLPQEQKETCCWHSVFCLGEEMGQALSFAIRG